jgi:rhodanese-related sulfurtransferase
MSLLNLFLSLISPSASGVRRVQPADAAQLVREKKAVLVDVREPAEWSSGVALPATLLALSDLTGARRNWKPFLDKNRDKELIFYCRSGTRSGHAARLLASEGFRTANAGTFHGWQSAGLPSGRPKVRH